jgi:hypothetical protein
VQARWASARCRRFSGDEIGVASIDAGDPNDQVPIGTGRCSLVWRSGVEILFGNRTKN